MVAEPVRLNPSLRPWHRAGVEFLLAADAVPAPCSLCLAAPVTAGGRIGAGTASATSQQGPRPTQPTTPANRVSPANPAASAAGGMHGATARPAPAGAHSPAGAPASAQGAASRAPYAAPHSAQSPVPQIGQASPQAVPYIHPDAWPPIWRQRLQKTAPAAVLWTYWALGEDMCVRPNPTRRALLQRMLADLGHPAGTHSFWPAALPQSIDSAAANPAVSPASAQVATSSAAPAPDTAPASGSAIAPDTAPSTAPDTAESLLYPAPEIFWSGVQHLKARALVVMGSPALKALELPSRLRPFQQTRHNGTLIVVLRDVDFLAQETNRYDAVKAFLRQALAPFGR